jgi:DNA-binding response OmpR family regulator
MAEEAASSSAFPFHPEYLMGIHILIVEDDAHIRLGLDELLRGEGFDVSTCATGDKAASMVEELSPALLILDIMLPGLSGYDICAQLRKRGFTLPILMLTAKGQEIDKVNGLDLGADDYMTKPFGMRELISRVHALLRRTAPSGNSVLNKNTFEIGSTEIDPQTFRIQRGGKTSSLTAKELKLLQLFHSRQDEVLSRDTLLTEVWGYHYFGTTRTLDQVIVQLRKKLGDDGVRLETVHGVGYRLTSGK